MENKSTCMIYWDQKTISAGIKRDLSTRGITSDRAVLPRKIDSPLEPMANVPKNCQTYHHRAIQYTITVPNASIKASSSPILSRRGTNVFLDVVACGGDSFRLAVLSPDVGALIWRRSSRRRGCVCSDTVDCRIRRASSSSRTRVQRRSILSCNTSVFARTILIEKDKIRCNRDSSPPTRRLCSPVSFPCCERTYIQRSR